MRLLRCPRTRGVNSRINILAPGTCPGAQLASSCRPTRVRAGRQPSAMLSDLLLALVRLRYYVIMIIAATNCRHYRPDSVHPPRGGVTQAAAGNRRGCNLEKRPFPTHHRKQPSSLTWKNAPPQLSKPTFTCLPTNYRQDYPSSNYRGGVRRCHLVSESVA